MCPNVHVAGLNSLCVCRDLFCFVKFERTERACTRNFRRSYNFHLQVIKNEVHFSEKITLGTELISVEEDAMVKCSKIK